MSNNPKEIKNPTKPLETRGRTTTPLTRPTPPPAPKPIDRGGKKA